MKEYRCTAKIEQPSGRHFEIVFDFQTTNAEKYLAKLAQVYSKSGKVFTVTNLVQR